MKIANWWLTFIHPFLYRRMVAAQRDPDVSLSDFQELRKEWRDLFGTEFK
jgi:hypothetical protein